MSRLTFAMILVLCEKHLHVINANSQQATRIGARPAINTDPQTEITLNGSIYEILPLLPGENGRLYYPCEAE